MCVCVLWGWGWGVIHGRIRASWCCPLSPPQKKKHLCACSSSDMLEEVKETVEVVEPKPERDEQQRTDE